MKRVQDLQVVRNYKTALTLANYSSYADGDVNIIDPATGIAWATGGESAVIAKVCSDSDGNLFLRQSLVLHSNNIQNYDYKDYATSSPKIIDIDTSAITAVTEGDVYELFITDYADAQYIVGRRRIEYVATAADAGAGDPSDAIKTGLITAINDDISLPNVTATDQALDTVRVTAAAVSGSTNVINGFRADYEVNFNIFLGENLINVATLATTVGSKGCGTEREVRKLEEVYKGYRGYLNRVIYPTSVNIQYDVATGDTFDMFTIMHKQPFHTNNEGDVPGLVSTIVAFDSTTVAVGETSADFKTDLDTAIAELM